MIRQNGASGGLILYRSGARTELSKAELRRQLCGRVRVLSAEERASGSREISRRIAELAAFDVAEQLLIYHALADEVSLEPLVERAHRRGKELFLPRTAAGAVFARWAPGEPLAAGPFGVLEPAASREPDDRATLVVVPGRGYDRAGRRLGRGAGWYDSALPRLAGRLCAVGVAFSCQLVESIPETRHDRRVDWVVTEDLTLECRAA